MVIANRIFQSWDETLLKIENSRVYLNLKIALFFIFEPKFYQKHHY